MLPKPDELIVRDCLVVSNRIRIPMSEITLEFVRSSGPGGQNVNKTNSQAQLYWNVAESEAIGRTLKLRLMQHYAKRISKAGTLRITSQKHRDQKLNRLECLNKLRLLVKGISIPPKQRKPTKPTKSSVRKRLDEKTKKSEKKQRRQPPRNDE